MSLEVGFTIDSVWGRDATNAAALARQCSRKPFMRLVFDKGIRAKQYLTAVKAIAPYARILGLPIDSSTAPAYGVADYSARYKEYVELLGPYVDTWEIGNEVNGEWLVWNKDEDRSLYYRDPNRAGRRVQAMVEGAADVCAFFKAKTAVTYYMNPGTSDTPTTDIWTWAQAFPLPATAYSLLSRYDDDQGGMLSLAQWQDSVSRLGAIRPTSKLGLGECGTKRPRAVIPFLTRFGLLIHQIKHPQWIGAPGGWWYGRQHFISSQSREEYFAAYLEDWFRE